MHGYGRDEEAFKARSAGSHKSKQAKHSGVGAISLAFKTNNCIASWVSFQRQFWAAGRQCVKEPTGNTKVREREREEGKGE